MDLRFNTQARPNWCMGCGNFGIQSALKKALIKLDIQPHQVVMASGIGCSSKIPHWLNMYGFHSLHGRAVPIAAGIKLANHELTVIAEGGDGDGFSEGLNHFLQAARRNIDFTYLVHDNEVFSLTTGQTSTTGDKGFQSKTTPFGSIEPPFSPLALALSAGAGFVARGFSGDSEQLTDLIEQAITYRGFSFLDILQVCVTYNPSKSVKWYKERVYKLEDNNHDPTNKMEALRLALSDTEDQLPTGIFYQTEMPIYEDSLPQIKKEPLVKHKITDVDIKPLIEQFR